jgi:hypothetical protein
VTTIFVADPRPVFQKLIEHVVRAYGFETSGHPDLVLTPDSRTARAWSGRLVPVLTYDDAESVEIMGVMATVLALVDP